MGGPTIRSIAPIVFFLLVATALTGCFGPGQDDDLLEKEDEQAGWQVTVQELDGSARPYHVESDWTKDDVDQDDLDDFQERALGLDPNRADTDGDGLLDGYNIKVAKSDDRFASWAKEGVVYRANDDGSRTYLGEWDHQAEPLKVDTDDDRLPDGDEVGGREYEICGVPTTVRSDPRQEDSDGDNLMDGNELFSHGTDPTRQDTDEDGATDLVDIDPCVNVVLQHASFTLDVTNETLDGPYWVEVHWPGRDFPVAIGPLSDSGGTSFDLREHVDAEDVDDAQGNLRDGDRNLTLHVFVYAGHGNDRRVIDVGSSGGGTSYVTLAYDGATGRQYVLDLNQQPVSSEDTEAFEGTDARLTLRLQQA